MKTLTRSRFGRAINVILLTTSLSVFSCAKPRPDTLRGISCSKTNRADELISLLRNTQNQKPEYYKELGIKLAKAKLSEDQITQIRSMLIAGTDSQKIGAIVVLGEIKDEMSMYMLRRELTNVNENVRLRAVEALGKLRDKKSAPFLHLMFKMEEDTKMLEAVIVALGKIKEENLETFVKLSIIATLTTSYENYNLALKALWAISNIFGKRVKSTLEMIKRSAKLTMIRHKAGKALKLISKGKPVPENF